MNTHPRGSECDEGYGCECDLNKARAINNKIMNKQDSGVQGECPAMEDYSLEDLGSNNMSTDDFNNLIKPLADKWADDLIKDGLVNEDGTIPMSEWANLSKHPFTINSGDLISINDNQTYYIAFHNKENKEIGKLNFDTDKLVFEGDVEQSAKNFMDYLLMVFNDKVDKLTMDAYKRGWEGGFEEYKKEFGPIEDY